MEEVSLIRTLNQSVSHTAKSPTASGPKLGKNETSGNPVATVVDVVADSVSSGKKVEAAEVSAAVENLNHRLELANNTLRFQIDDTTEEIKVQVVDKDTGRVVRTIPPEPSLSILTQGEYSGLLSVQG